MPPFEKHCHRTPGDVSEGLIATLETVPTFACWTVRVTSVSRLSHSVTDVQSTVGEISPPGYRSQGSSYIRGFPPTLHPLRLDNKRPVQITQLLPTLLNSHTISLNSNSV